MIVRPALLIGLILLLAGCSAPDVESSDAAAGPAPAEPAAPSQFTEPEQRAREAVAARLQIAVDFIEVVSSHAFNFPDSSLGCPQPGMAYVQSITPGYRVLVTANSEQFDVRVSGGRSLICDQAALRSPGAQRSY
jgi:hypothetical protein